MKKQIIIILLILLTFTLYSQKPRIKFEKLSVEDGMSQSSVLSIIQDSQGFMWFATLDGLNKYDGYNFKVYWSSSNKKDVITDNIVNVLYETTDKLNPTLWLGTAANGLCKYNKLKDNFISYTYSRQKENSISNNNINDIIGNNKILWLATDNGLNRFNQNIENFSYFKHSNNENSVCSDTILSLDIDVSGNLWIGTKNGLNFLNTKNNNVKRFSHLSEISQTTINDVYIDNEIIWLATPKGLYSYNIASDKVTKHNINLSSHASTNNIEITSILNDKDGIIWIGTRSNGFIWFNTKTFDSHIYKHEAMNKHSLSTNSILSIYRDRSNILWIGTSLGGVNKWNRAAEDIDVFRHNPYDENSLSAAQVRSFYVDKDENVWVGTVEGGLNMWDKKDNKFISFNHNSKKSNSISHNHIRSMLEDINGKFWVATDGGGLNLFNKKRKTFKYYTSNKDKPNSISHNRVWKVFEDSKHRLWVATFGGGLNLFSPEKESFKAYKYSEKETTSISSDLTTSILEDSKGNLWIGTFGGLNLFNHETETFTRYLNDKKKPNSLSNNRVYTIFEDSEGNLWVGTKGGLNRFDYQNKQFIRFDRENSDLPNNVILGITEDNGYLWLSTNSGISRIDKKTFKIKNFDIGDGLQSNEFLAGSVCKKNDGEILFGGIDGFNAFYPKKIIDNPHKPPIVITGLQISNQYVKTDTIISSKKQIVLEYFQNDISFDFVALDFIFPEKNKYKYILEGNDKEWTNALYRRFAKYTNLKPGEYIFKVIGSNNDDVWNEEGTSFKLIIKPAFWQTLWFKVTSVILAFFAVLIFFKLRMRAIKKRNEELESEVKRRTKEIRQQNDEIKAQRDELSYQKDQILEQKEEITDSIHYAKKIQTAALPTKDYIEENIPEHFILFKPRDIVSGDFYWVGRKENKIIITAVDCTGHGVPGAFMSMLGISFLNKIVNEKNITNSGEILNRLRANIINALHPKGYEKESKDGMDMSLCVIDIENNTIDFSGAYNSLIFMQDGKVSEVKADRMPVAKYDIMEPFSVKNINFKKGDAIYMTSDGYPDQFGGPKNKKFMKRKLKQLLEDTNHKSMLEQKEILEETIVNWMGNEPQIDDIVVIGIRL